MPQESLLRDTGHSVYSSVSLIEDVLSLHIIILFLALENNVSTEPIPEECEKTVHVLICET